MGGALRDIICRGVFVVGRVKKQIVAGVIVQVLQRKAAREAGRKR